MYLLHDTILFYNCVRCHSIGPVCADPESFVKWGRFFIFGLMRGGRIKIPLLAGHHRPASETPFKWGIAGVLMMSLH